MRVWLVQIGEELPFDPGPPRLLRTALLARELARRGHEVTLVNSTFSHQQKIARFGTTTILDSGDGYRAVLLQGRAYRRNVSVARVISQHQNVVAFRRWAAGERRPDLIMAGMPPVDLACAAEDYAASNGIPFVIDCRDLWPDIIRDYLLPAARLAASPLLAHWDARLAKAVRKANGVVGVSDGFVDWALAKAGRKRSRADRAFHLTVSGEKPSAAALAESEQRLQTQIGELRDDQIVGIFAGTFGRRLDILTIISAAETLPYHIKDRLRLVICGKGDLDSEIMKRAGNEPCLIYGGWRGAADLHNLMSRADFGILPYPLTRDFAVTFPNKVGEYLSFGLPIMTGLHGTTGDMLDERGLKLEYEAGNVASARDRLIAIAEQGPKTERENSARSAFHELFDPAQVYPAFAHYLETMVRRDEPDGEAAS